MSDENNTFENDNQQGGFGQGHAAFGARLDHARHLEPTEGLPQYRAPDAERGGEFVFVGYAAARAESFVFEVLNEFLFDLVYESISASVDPEVFHMIALVGI